MHKPRHVLERRQFGRRASFATARIAMPSGVSVPCSVLNISEGGALIELKEALALPPRFSLTFDSGLRLACGLCHQSQLRAGVEFVIAELQSQPARSSGFTQPDSPRDQAPILRLVDR